MRIAEPTQTNVGEPGGASAHSSGPTARRAAPVDYKITHALLSASVDMSPEEVAALSKRVDDWLMEILCPPQHEPTTLDMRKPPRCPECDRHRGSIINLCSKHMVS